MGNIKRTEVEQYQRAMGEIEKAAKSNFLEQLKKLDPKAPQFREQVQQLTEAYFRQYGQASALLAAEWYDFCVERDVGDRATFYATTDYDFENTRGTLTAQVDYYLDRIEYDDAAPEAVLDSISMTLGDYLNKTSRGVIIRNLEAENRQLEAGQYGWTRYKDSLEGATGSTGGRTRPPSVAPYGSLTSHGVAYMRVPRPDCTCAFCLTMAGRGAVYWTRRSAGGEGNKFHDHCRCTIVRVNSENPIVDGFDPSRMRDLYDTAAGAYDRGELPQEVYDRIDRARAHAYQDGKDFTRLNAVEIAMRYMYEMT